MRTLASLVVLSHRRFPADQVAWTVRTRGSIHLASDQVTSLLDLGSHNKNQAPTPHRLGALPRVTQRLGRRDQSGSAWRMRPAGLSSTNGDSDRASIMTVRLPSNRASSSRLVMLPVVTTSRRRGERFRR